MYVHVENWCCGSLHVLASQQQSKRCCGVWLGQTSKRQHGYTTSINGSIQVSCQNTWRHSSFCSTTSNFGRTSGCIHTKSLQLFVRRLYKMPKTSSAEGMKGEIKWETWRGKIRPCTSPPARAPRRECKSAGGSRCQLPSRVEWRGSAPLYRPRSFSRRSPLTTAFISPLSFSMLLSSLTMFQ